MPRSIEEMKKTINYIVISVSEFDAPIVQELLYMRGIKSDKFTLEELKNAVDDACLRKAEPQKDEES